jgi:hypothetical protein
MQMSEERKEKKNVKTSERIHIMASKVITHMFLKKRKKENIGKT